MRTLVSLAALTVLPLLAAAEGCEAKRPVGPTESGTVVRVTPEPERNRDVVEVKTPDDQSFTVRLNVGDCLVGQRYPDCTTD